jgi:anti-sigma factor NepR-like protein
MDLQGAETVPVAKLGPDIKAKIGQQLRMMYGEVVNQGVPARFVEILRGLDTPQTDEGPKE